MALLAIFAALTATSMIIVYTTHQLPTERQTTTTLAAYQQTGTYYYIAKLKPNVLYNQSTLKPGEGTLYIQIIDHINVTFSYTFQCNRPTNTSIQYYYVNMELESPGKWLKVFTVEEMQEMFQLAKKVNSNGDASTNFTIRIVQINELVNLIDEETKTSTTSFNLKVEPEIYTVAKTDVGVINEKFNSTLTIEFKYGAEIEHISMEDLQQTSSGTIKRDEQVLLQSTRDQRYIAYAMAMASFAGLAFATWVFMKSKVAEIKPMEEIIAPHKETIFDVAEEPSYEGQRVTITMKSLEDLVKLADGLDQPVFHLKKPPKAPSEKPTHIFYVLDGLTKYEYRTIGPNQAQK